MTLITMVMVAIAIGFGVRLQREFLRKKIKEKNLIIISAFGFFMELIAVWVLPKPQVDFDDAYAVWAAGDSMGAIWLLSFVVYVATAGIIAYQRGKHRVQ